MRAAQPPAGPAESPCLAADRARTVAVVLLRPETPADHGAVRALHRAAFGDHGAVVAALADDLRTTLLGPGPGPVPGTGDRDAARGGSWVADHDGAVVGHVMLAPALLDAPERLVDVLVLSPLAVLPERQRRGIGAALVARALAEADAQGAPLVFLEGDPGYYGRLGFLRADEHGFRKPSLRIPDAAFQVAPLAAARPWMSGTLVYPDVFWRHDAVGLRPAG